MYSGSCLCGGVQFHIEGELPPIQVCHCSLCRKAQGAPFAANIPVKRDHLKFVAGEDLLKRFASNPDKHRVFCSVCGSPIFSERISAPGVVRIRAGLLNEALANGPAFHAYVGSKCNWWQIDDALPRYEEGYIEPSKT